MKHCLSKNDKAGAELYKKRIEEKMLRFPDKYPAPKKEKSNSK